MQELVSQRARLDAMQLHFEQVVTLDPIIQNFQQDLVQSRGRVKISKFFVTLSDGPFQTGAEMPIKKEAGTLAFDAWPSVGN